MSDIAIIDSHHHLYDRQRNASPMMQDGTIKDSMTMLALLMHNRLDTAR